MKAKLTLTVVLSFIVTLSLMGQEKKRKDDMRLIYSSSWDCQCESTNFKHSKKYKRNRYSKAYYDYGIEEELDFFSQIGANPAVYGFSPEVQALHFNRVNGFFLGIDSEYDDFLNDIFDIDNLNIEGLVGYSFGREEWQYQVGIDKPIGRRARIGADYHNVTNTEDTWRSGLTENTISSVVTGYDFHDYFKAEGYSIHGSYRLGYRTFLGLSYNVDNLSSLEEVTAYNIFGDGNIARPNPSIDGAFNKIYQESIGFSLNINPRLYYIANNLSTSLTVRGEIANLAKTNNDFFYNKYIVETKSMLRLDRSTFLKWRLMGGAVTGTAPDFKQFALGGIGSMRATDYKSLQGNTMVLSNLELILGKHSDFDFGFFEIDGVYLSFFIDSGWSEFNNDLNSTIDPTTAFENFAVSDLAHNGGIGLGSDMFRVEIAKPLTGSDGFTALWIRLNPSF